MKILSSPFGRFLLRWLVCSLGIWIAAAFLSGSISYQDQARVVVISGFVLAIVNSIIKPILVVFTLPAIFLTLGLFMIVINGLTVWLASSLYKPLEITNFWAAMFAGMVIGLVNYLVTAILEDISGEHI
jgi:putative membrane protein